MTRGHHHHNVISDTVVEIVRCSVWKHKDREDLVHPEYGEPCYKMSHTVYGGQRRQVAKCDLCWDPAVKGGLACRTHSPQLAGSGKVIFCTFCGASQRSHAPGFHAHTQRIIVEQSEVRNGNRRLQRSGGGEGRTGSRGSTTIL